jgi:hypothetical protein
MNESLMSGVFYILAVITEWYKSFSDDVMFRLEH